MSDQDTIFSGDDNSQAAAETNTLPDEASELVGEGKKYSSVGEAIKALYYSQKHIATIEEENKTLREEVERAKKLDDILKKVDQKEEKKASEPIADVDKLLDEKLEQRERQANIRNNLVFASNKMTERFGEEAKKVMLDKANDLGLTVDDMMSVASNSPSAFLNWFGLSMTQSATPSVSKNSTVNTESFNKGAGTAQPGSYKFYERMRKEDPKRYFSQQVQLEIQKHATQKGQAFFA